MESSKEIRFLKFFFMFGDYFLIVGLWGDVGLEFLGERLGCGGVFRLFIV